MYLSRVEIDFKNRRKISDLTHLGAYHNWVEQSFTEKYDEKKRPRNLWRIDNLKGKYYLLILSENMPDKTKLLKYGVRGTAETKDYSSYLNKLKTNQILQFRLSANPSYKISIPGRKQGKVVPHITIEQQKKWLLDKAKNNGFEIMNTPSGEKAFDIVSREWKNLYHKNSGRVKLSCVTFEGILKIKDLQKFKQALTTGIGREKAYGMGLLTVIPR